MTRSLVLLPTYNEAENIEQIVEAILRESDADVLIVDDNSPDGTGALGDQLQCSYPSRVEVLHRPAKEGLGPAYADGYAAALAGGYDVIAQMDADFSHDPSDLPRLVAAVEEGADVAVGSRYASGGQTPGWPWRRRLLSWAGSRYAAAVLSLPVRDVTGGFKAFSRRALHTLAAQTPRASGFAIQIETTYWAHRQGLILREVPIVFRDRRAGASKMSLGIVAEALRLPWQLRWAALAPPARPAPLLAAEPPRDNPLVAGWRRADGAVPVANHDYPDAAA